ncbi:TspO/MBR family protein [Methyloceanibacter sp. wino2]|uniref:TspO/MBR family protein n=1 Tax=Methyloceanibacter sp. wino2 TaxID=2170729 RepID=UPI000D3E9C6C|nr:TspO/MBR family protein [Methyloceanibacter sp. wino2]
MSSVAEPITSKRSLVGLGVALLICFAASLVGSAFTTPNLGWYATLEKPGFTPPNSVFPIVWTILFAMMAVSAWLVWRQPADEGEKKTALTWFGIQLALNVLWSFAFFQMHSPIAGLAVILWLLVAIVLTMVFFDRVSRVAALLLIPYLLWVGFAAGLNFAIWALNAGAA